MRWATATILTLSMLALGALVVLTTRGMRAGAQAELEGLAPTGNEDPVARSSEPEGASARTSSPRRAPPQARSRLEVPPAREVPGGQRVRVIDARSGARLPGAEVWIGPSPPLEETIDVRVAMTLPDLEAIVHAEGRRVLADERGELWLGQEDRCPILCARHESLYGECALRVRDMSQTLTLALYPDRDLELVVVDALGEPAAGVPLRFEGHRRDGCVVLRYRTTDAEGLVGLKHAPAVFGEYLPRGRAEVLFDLPLEEALAATLDPDLLPDGPLRLELPATGRVEVEVLDASGAPWHAGGRIVLQHRAPSPWLPRVEHTTASAEASLEAGRAHFERVGLGLQLEASLATPEHPSVKHVGPGPVQTGQVTAISLQVGPSVPILVGQAIDGAGQPLKDARLRVVEPKGSGYVTTHGQALCGRAGQFRLVLPSLPRDGAARALELEYLDERSRVRGRSKQLPLSSPLPLGDIEVGTVELPEPALLVSGVVLDEHGNPAPDVLVRLLVPDDDGEGWDNTLPTPERTDEAGRFEHLAARDPRVGAVWVHVSRMLRSPPTPFVPGQRDLVVRLVRSASLAGSVRVEPRFRGELWIDARCGQRPTPPTRPNEADGSFEIEGLEPGSYEVRVRAAWTDAVVLVPGVVVEAARRNTDPRLREIDLRGRLHALELRLLDSRGLPLIEGTVTMRPSRTPNVRPRSVGLRNGVLRCVSTERQFDLWIDAPGHRSEVRTGIAGSHEIALRKSLSLRVRAPFQHELPQGVRSFAALLPTSERARPGRHAAGLSQVGPLALDPEDGACFEICDPRQFRIKLLFRWDRGGQERVTSLLPQAEHGLVRVEDLPGEQTFEIHVEPSLLARTLQEIRSERR